MTDMEKKLAFLLATSPYLVLAWDCTYEEAAMDLVANGVVPVVQCKDCKHGNLENDTFATTPIWICHVSRTVVYDNHFCSYGKRRADNG